MPMQSSRFMEEYGQLSPSAVWALAKRVLLSPLRPILIEVQWKAMVDCAEESAGCSEQRYVDYANFGTDVDGGTESVPQMERK